MPRYGFIGSSCDCQLFIGSDYKYFYRAVCGSYIDRKFMRIVIASMVKISPNTSMPRQTFALTNGTSSPMVSVNITASTLPVIVR